MTASTRLGGHASTALRRSAARDFTSRVLSAVRRIPPGRVATYGDIAALAGKPRASRAVGNIMRGCGDPGVPCHRVIAAGGSLGGYGGNLQLKRELLRAEGVEVGMGRIRGFERLRWRPTPHKGRKGGSSGTPSGGGSSRG
jgi:methylated-DNA-[protein]-cysteine S-methyltransferase